MEFLKYPNIKENNNINEYNQNINCLEIRKNNEEKFDTLLESMLLDIKKE